MKYLIAIICFVFVINSKNKQENTTQLVNNSIEKTSNAAVVIHMEGKTHTIQQANLQPITIDFKNNELQFVIWEDGNPVQTNINLSDIVLKEKGTAIYNIPEANSPAIKIDLNFYDQNRNVSRMNKRIVFRKGTINIKALTEHSLIMTFDGEGGGMMKSKESFPIKGSININY